MCRVQVEEDLEPVEQELNILLQTDHPHIVKFYEAFLDHKYVHIVMELCPGADLNQIISKIKRFQEKDAATIVYQLLLAISHLHDLNICHRDLKLENILLNNDGSSIKLIDFGLSKLMGK
jgi:serine/threonine protein kinase